MTTLLEDYQAQCNTGLITEDPQQLMVLSHLQTVLDHLVHEKKQRNKLLASFRKSRPVKGLYVWGSVGIGKTFLMDCFYNQLPFENKMRMHFHAFMQMIHKELKANQGEKNPLDLIAKKIARQTMVLCFDEFVVNDIVDAMLLARLLHALFLQGVSLVATSNTMPDELYKRGLQRPLFLPAIALIKKHTQVIHVTTDTDYRLRHLKEAGVFFTPNDKAADTQLEHAFDILANDKEIHSEPLAINDRLITIKKQAGDVVWFDFQDLCSPPRSQQDYLAITTQFHTVIISNIPKLNEHAHNNIVLFIRLIDIFYDNHIRVIISAEGSVNDIYSEGRMLQEYARTKSRLIEMQSAQYYLA